MSLFELTAVITDTALNDRNTAIAPKFMVPPITLWNVPSITSKSAYNLQQRYNNIKFNIQIHTQACVIFSIILLLLLLVFFSSFYLFIVFIYTFVLLA